MLVNGSPRRTVWIEADGISIGVIDQRKLPFHFETLVLRSTAEVCLAIRNIFYQKVGNRPVNMLTHCKAGDHLMQEGMVDLVITGTDRTTCTGDVANKIGTYLKALAPHDNGIPFYVALPSSSFDWETQDGGAGIPIEQRCGSEVSVIGGSPCSGSSGVGGEVNDPCP